MDNDTQGPPASGWARLVPELLVEDFAASLSFWRGLLGFEIAYRRPEPPFAYLEHPGGAQIMLCQRDGEWETGPLQRPFGRGMMLQLGLDDITPILAGLHAAGWPLYREPREVWRRAGRRRVGQYEVWLQDPDGYLIMLAHATGDEPAQ